MTSNAMRALNDLLTRASYHHDIATRTNVNAMKIYVAQYTTDLDVECILDDKYDAPSMMCHVLSSLAFAHSMSTSRDETLAKCIATFANEIRDTADPDEPPPSVPTLDTVKFIPDHEFSTDDIFVYEYKNDDIDARILIREFSI